MKASYLLFLTMSCAGLMDGTSYAAPSQQVSAEGSASTASGRSHDAESVAPADDGKRQKEESPSAGQSDEQKAPRHASAKNHPRSRVSLTAVNRPKQLPNSRKRSLPGNAIGLHQLGSDKSGGAVTGELIHHETANNAPPVQPTSVVRPTVASLHNVRHRGPNPAVVAGSANSNSRNTGAINGTRMNRRP
jgi:hypothetical protein